MSFRPVAPVPFLVCAVFVPRFNSSFEIAHKRTIPAFAVNNPGAIMPHGVLMLVDEADNLNIKGLSQNCDQFFGRDVPDMIGTNMQQVPSLQYIGRCAAHRPCLPIAYAPTMYHRATLRPIFGPVQFAAHGYTGFWMHPNTTNPEPLFPVTDTPCYAPVPDAVL